MSQVSGRALDTIRIDNISGAGFAGFPSRQSFFILFFFFFLFVVFSDNFFFAKA